MLSHSNNTKVGMRKGLSSGNWRLSAWLTHCDRAVRRYDDDRDIEQVSGQRSMQSFVNELVKQATEAGMRYWTAGRQKKYY